MRIGHVTREEICTALFGKKGAEARITIAEISNRLKISEGYLYKLTYAARSNLRQHRKDLGVQRIEVAQEVKDFMFGLTRDADMSADHVLLIAARHFGLPEDFMSVATYNNWLRRERVSRAENKKDLRPYNQHLWRNRANALHQYDTTVALAFYANDDGSIGHEPGYERYKNKPGNRRPRLHLYSLVDYYSSVLFAKFYFSENALNLLDFVFCAWAEKKDWRFPFYGIPDEMYCDHGSPAKSAKFSHALQVLGVEMVDTEPSHWTEFGSRKHGRVERTFGEGLLKEFMKTTSIYRYASIEEINAALWDWLIRMNNKIHRTHKETRFGRWIRAVETPRSMPSEEMFKLLHYDRTVRTVARNLQLQLNGKVFQLPHRKPFINWVDAKVEIYWYPGREETATVVYDFHEEEIKALAPVVEIESQYMAVPKTDREELVERLKAQDYSSVNFPAIYAPEKDLPYVPRRGKAFDEKRIAEKMVAGSDGQERPSHAPMRYLDRFQVREVLAKKGIFGDEKLSDAERAWLASLMNGRERISEEEVDEVVKKAKAQTTEDLAEER